jgi:hypothetical protein
MKRVLTKDVIEEIISKKQIKNPVLFDENLFVQGTMSPNDNKEIIKFWESKGLVAMEKRGKQKYWKDLCIVSYPDTEPTLSCNWIEIFRENEESFTIYGNLKGKSRGSLITDPVKPEQFFKKLLSDKKNLSFNLFDNFNMNNFKFIERIVSDKFYLLLIVFLALVLLGFYWLSFRPYQARKDCANKLPTYCLNSAIRPATAEQCDNVLKSCLIQKGINY